MRGRRPRLPKRERYDSRRRRGEPPWFDDDADPCDCPEAERDLTTLRSATGYSDCGYYRVLCETCGETYCTWVEG